MTKNTNQIQHESAINQLNIQAWTHDVASKTEKTTAYALEKYYVSAQPNYDGIFINSNKFKNFVDGLQFPPIEIVDFFGELSNSTKRTLDSPFWKLLKTPHMTPDELIILSNEFPFDIAIHLKNQKIMMKYFERICSIDSLAACLWIIADSRNHLTYYPSELMKTAIRFAMRIFLRLATDDAFLKISKPLFRCLQSTFLFQREDEKLLSEVMNVDLDEQLSKYLFMRSLVDEVKLLKSYKRAPVSCLHLTEKYLSKHVISDIKVAYEAGNLKAIKHNLSIKRLSRSLKRWEENELQYKETLYLDPATFIDPETEEIFYFLNSLAYLARNKHIDFQVLAS